MSENSTKSLAKLVGGAVTLMMGLVAISLIATNPHESFSPVRAVTRAPASLVDRAFSAPKPAPLVERTQILTPDCIENLTSSVVDKEIRQIRLRSHLCQAPGPEQVTEILNVTNGFFATVFTSGTNVVTSDYIHLSEGENRLRVTRTLADGKIITSEMKITRQ